MESTNVGRGVGIFPGNGEDGVVMSKFYFNYSTTRSKKENLSQKMG